MIRGEVYRRRDRNGKERLHLVIHVNYGYCSYVILNENVRPDNIAVKLNGRTYGVCPYKLLSMHCNEFAEFVGTLDADGVYSVLTAISEALDLPSAYARELTELRLYKELYLQLVDKVAVASMPMIPVIGAAVDEPKKPEPKKRIPADEYAKQAYIQVKCKKIGITMNALARLCDRSPSCMSDWVNCKSPAKWHLLERVWPGLEAEADKWFEKEGKSNA